MSNNRLNADYIKQSLAPLDFYRYELPTAKLKTHGWNEGGLCPFHNDNKAGSFRINLDSGAFTCYACNTKGGDIVAFIMNRYALTFYESLRKIADDWGIV
jgi:DNA primase